MLILVTISLFIFIPLVMLFLYLLRPRFNAQGFLAAITVLVGWILVLLAQSDLPRHISLLTWEPEFLFRPSPILIIDQNSWFLTLALTTLALSVIITSIAQIGISQTPSEQIPQDQMQSPGSSTGETGTALANGTIPYPALPNWSHWAAILVLTSLSLIAVTAGNLLTLLLAWTALDILELIILLGQIPQSMTRERIILAFSAKMIGICIVLLAAVVVWPEGISISLENIPPSLCIFLVLAAGLRLGVLPLHLPYTKGLPINRNLGTGLRLIPAAATYILLVRASTIGVKGAITPYLLGLTILAGVYATVNWLRAKDELQGRPYWLLGTSSLAVTAAIFNQPLACLTWSIASLLSGGLVFNLALHHKRLIPLIVLGMIGLSGLPFSPTWQGNALLQLSSLSGLNQLGSVVILFFVLLIQAFLLAGFIRHALQGILPGTEDSPTHIERWVWFLYSLGLVFIVFTHFLIGWRMAPNLQYITISAWLGGPILLFITGLILFFSWRYPHPDQLSLDPKLRSAWDRLFSLEWLYRLLWNLFRTLTRASALVSAVLEGDGGLLWALVLFGLIFVFLQR